jgi:predicted N-acetyltransferase YhbS
MKYEIRRLTAEDDCSVFSCGDVDLDRFFQRYAALNQFEHHIGVTYVAIAAQEILAFVTVAPSEIVLQSLPRPRKAGLPKYPVPVLRLARLGVAVDWQRKGLGLAMLRFTFNLALRMSSDLGCAGVIVDAKPRAISFYERYGFVPLKALSGTLGDRPQTTPMFLELGAITAALG